MHKARSCDNMTCFPKNPSANTRFNVALVNADAH